MFRAVPVGEKWGKEFISWDTCPLHIPGIQATLPRLSRVLVEHAPEFSAASLFGVWIGSPHLVIVAKDFPSDGFRRIDWSSVLSDPLRQVSFHRANQVGKTVFGAGPITPIYGEATDSPPPIRAFRQVARTLLERARAEAVTALLRDSPPLVLDLYCGTGEIARGLPPGVAWIGIEASREAAAYAGAYVGFVESRLRDPRLIERIGGKYALYINPPRPGLGESARKVLFDLVRDRPPTSVVYLSCSASSLARDLAMFETAGFRVESLQPFDFFPQTEHFETLAILRS
jgi:23S rRNA (uracil1939-C5)-methyltransferase